MSPQLSGISREEAGQTALRGGFRTIRLISAPPTTRVPGRRPSRSRIARDLATLRWKGGWKRGWMLPRTVICKLPVEETPHKGPPCSA